MKMIRRLIFLVVVMLISAGSFAQSNEVWGRWSWLVGSWSGDGKGSPGQGAGGFSFAFELNSNILVRRSHTEFPATGGRPAFVHDDLMVVHTDNGKEPVRAVYFDNEGHVINYLISYSDKSVVLTSIKQEGMPVFRLTYSPAADGGVTTKFEISRDGTQFNTYIEGKSRKQ